MPQDSRARLKQWIESGEARLHPLSFPQRELWENSPIPVESPANHMCGLVEIKAALTEKESIAAVQRVVDRQEALRTSFLRGKEGPLQLIRSTAAAHVRYRELSATELRPEHLAEMMREFNSRPFDIVQGPLYRAEVLRRGANDHLLVFSIHHAIADGWSFAIFVKDLATAYVMGLPGPRRAAAANVIGIPQSLPPVPQSYTAWASAERLFWREPELKPRIEYWKNKLSGSRKLWSPEGAAVRAQAPLERWVASIPEGQTAAVRQLARSSGATLFSTLLSVFQLTLFKWTGQEDLVVGTPIANRSRAASHQTVGYFSGVVPLRIRLDRSGTLAEHVKSVQEAAVEGFANAMPFAELAAALGEPRSHGFHSVFDVRFALHNYPAPDAALLRISTKLQVLSLGTARFDLGCDLTETGKELSVSWLFKASLFTPTNIAELHKLFLELLGVFCQSPGRRIEALSF